MRNRLLIMGAGAIGRGFLPWVIDLTRHDIVFVDKNPLIVETLKTLKTFTTYRVMGKKYEELKVPIAEAYLLEEFSVNNQEQLLAAFFAVGPRNVEEAAKSIIGSKFPIIVCENEPSCVEQVKRVLGHSNVYFAVPDVIASNTAPKYLSSIDSLAVVTEQGEFYVEEGPTELYGNFNFVPKTELIEIQWTPKLFLHNTPHSIAAYLGALVGEEFVHEAMNHQAISKIVEGAMNEMLQSLKIQWNIPHDFLDWYANKELERFRSKLLYDPISRVAREPLRKLEKHGRLLGAAQICLSLGVLPKNIVKGIIAALLFQNEKDPDNYLSMMRDVMGMRDFNRYILGLRPGEPLDLMLSNQSFDVKEIVNELLSVRNV